MVEVEEEFELPAELAAMIIEAKHQSSPPAAAPTRQNVKYYANYNEGSCSSKSTNKFSSWEESFDSLEDCCDVAFSWDYDACMGSV